jgi:siroheme synthase (precorrin-2 oxidase/ferrochelatase)
MITVTTEGKSPTLTALLRDQLAGEFGPEWGTLTAVLGRLRKRVKTAGDEAARRRAVQMIMEDELMQELTRRGDFDEAEARAECLLSSSE